MILQPSNVELTKIHYYEKNSPGGAKNISINTISHEIHDNTHNRNVIIKKNIFGHRWVLKINEDNQQVEKKSHWKLFVYVLVFFSISVAVGFGIFLTLDNTVFKRREKIVKSYIYPKDIGIRNRPKPEPINVSTTNHNGVIIIPDDENFTTESLAEKKPYCTNCTFQREICMKVNDTSKPECVAAVDENDPTGCGGICQINTEFCQILSNKYNVYQCLPRKATLICKIEQFNCGNMCINMEKRCDGVIDCSNRSDEENCPCDYTSHFHCGEKTSCLPKSQKCDQIINCWDGSDEQNCYYENTCGIGEHSCNNGFCIRTDQLCDGRPDCTDKSDEPDGCSVYNVPSEITLEKTRIK